MITPAARPAAGWVGVGLLVWVVVFGWTVSGQSKAGGADRDVDRWLVAHLGDGWAVRVLADAGNPAPIVVAAAVLAAAGWWSGDRRRAALAVVAPIVTVGLCDLVLKPLFDRRLHGALVFPSGHEAAVAGVATVLVIAVTTPRRVVRVGVAVVLAGLSVAVALALVAAGYHYLTDTMAGLALGVASTIGVALAIDATVDGVRWPRPPGNR
jgi:membrane-associated phospholipid phosphatase